jgi:hypothetical protein
VTGPGGAGLAAGLLTAFGARRSPAVAAGQDEANGEICVLEFTGTIRLGPSEERRSTREIAGRLRVRVQENGDLDDSELVLEDGDTMPVYGQATGSAVTFLFRLEDGDAVAIGAGVNALSQFCPSVGSTFSGLLKGPRPGDLGDWEAEVVRLASDACPDVDVECDVECDDDEFLTTDCECVPDFDPPCDVACEPGETLAGNCSCVCRARSG